MTNKAQSEAPSVETQIKTAFKLALASEPTEDGKKAIERFYYTFLNNYPGFDAKINRLITEAELKGFDMAYDSHDYDRLRAYRQQLSNNLSKGDGDG